MRPAGGMELGQLTDYINSLNLAAQQRANAGRIPGATGLETASSGNIASELAGQPSASTIRLLQQQAAERGVATGVGGDSPNATAAYLQALGLTSEQLQETGQRDLSAALGRNPAAPIFDPTSQLMTPYQSEQLNLERQRLAQEAGGGGGGYAAPRVGSVGGGGGQTFTSPDLGPVDSGYTPNAAWASDPQAAWWNSIGYAGSPTLNQNNEADVAASLGWDMPVSQPAGDFSGLTDIFGPDLSSVYLPTG